MVVMPHTSSTTRSETGQGSQLLHSETHHGLHQGHVPLGCSQWGTGQACSWSHGAPLTFLDLPCAARFPRISPTFSLAPLHPVSDHVMV